MLLISPHQAFLAIKCKG